ncbi:MAG: NADH:flavin oxidoreductase/NADH oxidase [bacterium]|nr:NADH:flavin oxidoreductase/NADH oxidase [bacterium]
MTALFSPFTVRGVTLRNRIGMSPMCQYSADDGRVNDWHIAHYGGRAAGGVGLVIVEATAVEARGRITPHDLGIWRDDHQDGLARLAAFIDSQGAVPAIQIAHAGRKAGTARPWEGGSPLTDEQGGGLPAAPSPIPFADGFRTPHALTPGEMDGLIGAFVTAARRALWAGFRWIELHAAHGYLLHSFHSPISNTRTDAYGGTLENRTRLTVETVRALRAEIGTDVPLAVRLSCTDWIDGGWTLDDTVWTAARLKNAGADLIDCSSGGTARVKIPTAPGYQVPFAHTVRHGAQMPTAAVGLITDPAHADAIIAEHQADLVLLGRELLRNPVWPQQAARQLLGSAKDILPKAYIWATD